MQFTLSMGRQFPTDNIVHPDAEIEAYRQDSANVRLRIVDANFKGMSLMDRHNSIWASIDHLPLGVLSQVSILLPLTPDEKTISFASQDFDDPVPSDF